MDERKKIIRRGRNREKDWAAIRAEYITGEMSTRALAAKHGLSVYAVCDHCSREGWVEARERYREDVARDAVQEYRARDSHRIADQLQDIAEAAQLTAKALLEAARDPEQYQRHLVQESDKGKIRTVERVFAKRDTRAALDLSKALGELGRTLRTVYGIPTYMEEQQLQQARERLELERAKAQLSGDGAEDGGVLVLAAVEEQQEAADDGGEA